MARTWWRYYGGLALAMGIVVCGAAAIALDAPQPLRAVGGAGLVLWAPGFALSMALFTHGTIGAAERAVIAVAASLAVTALVAVLLEAAGARLGTTSFVLAAYAVTLVATTIAVLRLPRLADVHVARARRRPPATLVAALACLAVVLAGAVVTARITPEPSSIPGSSTLAVTAAGPALVRAEVISEELEPTSYRLAMVVDAGSSEVARFTVPPGGSWKRVLRRPAGSDSVELILYRGAERQPFRRTVLASLPG